MRRVIFLSLIIAMIIVSCTQEKKLPIEGAWKLVYGQRQSIEGTFPAQVMGSDIKIWSKDYFASVGQLKVDTIIYDAYVGGKYSLEGGRFTEEILYHAMKSSVGTKARLLLEIRNDTLIQRWPVDESWKLQEKYNTEKYIRLE